MPVLTKLPNGPFVVPGARTMTVKEFRSLAAAANLRGVKSLSEEVRGKREVITFHRLEDWKGWVLPAHNPPSALGSYSGYAHEYAARCVAILMGDGFRIEAISPVDVLPWSSNPGEIDETRQHFLRTRVGLGNLPETAKVLVSALVIAELDSQTDMKRMGGMICSHPSKLHTTRVNGSGGRISIIYGYQYLAVLKTPEGIEAIISNIERVAGLRARQHTDAPHSAATSEIMDLIADAPPELIG